MLRYPSPPMADETRATTSIVVLYTVLALLFWVLALGLGDGGASEVQVGWTGFALNVFLLLPLWKGGSWSIPLLALYALGLAAVIADGGVPPSGPMFGVLSLVAALMFLLLCVLGYLKRDVGSEDPRSEASRILRAGRRLMYPLALLAIFGSAGEVSAEAGGEGGGVRQVVRVRLGRGDIGNYRWAVYAGRSKPSSSGRRPCITAFSGPASEAGPTAGFSLCGMISRDTQILVGKSDGVGRRQRSVVGGAFSPHVRSVKFWLRGRGNRRIVLNRLGEKQAKEAG